MVSNSEFLDSVYGELGQGIHGWVASFRGDPNAVAPDVWGGSLYLGTENQRLLVDKRTDDNNYYCVARLKMNGAFRRSKSHFDQLAVLVADDADPGELNGTPSFVIETSPGNHQIGVLLDETDSATRNVKLIDAVMQAMADARLIRADSSGNNAVRYCRLPVGTNGKGGRNQAARLAQWNPNARYTLEDALAIFGIDLEAVRSRVPAVTSRVSDTPSDAENGALIQSILSGESYHDPLVKLSAKLVASGASGGAVVNLLRGVMDAARPGSPSELERWQSRYNEIPRMVAGAERFRPEPVAPITINLGGAKPATPAELVPMSWAALAARPPEPATFFWEGWLPARTTTLLSANGGVGKSNLSLQLAAALALGERFLGHQLEPRRVLVISAEDEARTVHFRLANILSDLGVELTALENRLVAYDLTQLDCVLWREGAPSARMQWLADVVEQHQAEVVILDNASDVFNSNENDRAEVRGFMRSLNAIAHHSGAAMLLLAHVDKASVRSGAGQDSNSTFSGSTAWNNSARSRWAMTRDEDTVVLKHEKCNLGPLQGLLRLEYDPAANVFRKFGDVASSAFARQVSRNSRRVAILKQMEKAIRVGQKMSLAPTSNNNVYTVLNGKQAFPDMTRKEFFAEVMAMQRDDLIVEREYRVRGHDRKEIALTAAGEEVILRAE
jgi:RecA-family ATPase